MNRQQAAAIYCRISRDHDGEGLGVARQERACRDLAQSHGWEVVRVFTDNDISAWSGKERPEYAAMLSSAERGEFGHIVAWAPDRLHRNLREMLDMVDRLDRAGVETRTVTSGSVGKADEGSYLSAVLQGFMGQAESTRRSKRLREKMAEKARNGLPHGPRGFGYDNSMELIPEQAMVVRECAERLLAGEGLTSVANDLNHREVPGTSGRAGVWTSSTLKTIMLSPRIAGLRRHHSRPQGEDNRGGLWRGQGDLYPAQWQGIISREDWERLRDRLDGKQRRKPSPARSAILTGLLYCGREDCGRLLVGGRYEDGQRNYGCRSGIGGCKRTTVKAEPLEEWLELQVREALAGGPMTEYEAPDEEDGLAVVLADIRTLDGDIAAVDEDFAGRLLSKEEWRTLRSSLVAQREEKMAERDRLELLRDRPHWTPERWSVDWDADDDAKRRNAMLRTVLRRVTVGKGRPGVRGVDPDRLKVEWLV